MKKSVTIIADDRESRSEVIPSLREIEGVTVNIRRLAIGDYSADDWLVFERKTLRDFAISIIDGRLFRQMIRLASSKQKGVLILEGTGKDLKETGMKRESIQGALVTVSLILGVPVLRSISVNETARLMVYAIRQLRSISGEGVHRSGYKPKNKRKRQLFILQGLPGIGRERAGRLLEHFGSVEAVVTASRENLVSVDGIGKDTVEKIKWAVRERLASFGSDGK